MPSTPLTSSTLAGLGLCFDSLSLSSSTSSFSSGQENFDAIFSDAHASWSSHSDSVTPPLSPSPLDDKPLPMPPYPDYPTPPLPQFTCFFSAQHGPTAANETPVPAGTPRPKPKKRVRFVDAVELGYEGGTECEGSRIRRRTRVARNTKSARPRAGRRAPEPVSILKRGSVPRAPLLRPIVLENSPSPVMLSSPAACGLWTDDYTWALESPIQDTVPPIDGVEPSTLVGLGFGFGVTF